MFNKMKDMALSKTAKIAINSKIKDYGEVLDIKLDTKNHSIELETLLKGEVEPLTVSIGKYTLKEDEITISGINTSREWINTLAKSYFEEKSFKVPKEYIYILEKIV